MSIDNVSPSTSIGGAGFNPATLSPEGLLAYCSATLNNLDTEISKRMGDQQAQTAKQKAIGEAISQFQGWTGGMPARKEEEMTNFRGMAQGLVEQYNKNTDPTTREIIAAAYKACTSKELSAGPDGRAVTSPLPGNLKLEDLKDVKDMSAEQWMQTTTTRAKQAQETLSKGSDMAMIEIQSLVSKRQLGIQLTTQIMQSANEGTKGVVGNIGR